MVDCLQPMPASFLLSDPLLLMLGGAGLLRLPRARALDLRAVSALMIGLLIPVLLILTFADMAFRYRMEFHPFLEYTAFLGFYAICGGPGQFSELSRSRLSRMLIASAGLGIVCSHLLLFLSKISPIGCISAPNEWIDYDFIQLKLLFPSIAQRLHL
jgi:hypothetical protein